MPKINITVTEAINNINSLLTKLEEVKQDIALISKASGGSFDKLTAETKKLNTNITSLDKKFDTLTSSINANTKAQNKQSIATKKATTATKKQTAAGKSLFRNLGQLAGALGFAGVIAVIGKTILSVINLTIKFQSLGFALEKIAGNAIENIDSMGFLMELNDKFGATLATTTERWLKFRAAAKNSGVTLTKTKDIFRSVTKAAAVLGLRTDELRGIYLALEQMLSKGKVTTEELRRQLGERLPGAMGIMADALGVSISQLDKMMKKGEILSAVALPKFALALEKAYGIESLKTVDNLATGVGKMSGAWDRFVLTISEGDSVISNAIGGTMVLITNALNAMTNFLETYEQESTRTSTQLFGESVKKAISLRIENILKEKGLLKETEEQLQKNVDIAQEAFDVSKTTIKEGEKASKEHLANIKKLGEEQVKLETLQELKFKTGQSHARLRLQTEKDILKVNREQVAADEELIRRGDAEKDREGDPDPLVGVFKAAFPNAIKDAKALTEEEWNQYYIAKATIEATKEGGIQQLEFVKQYNALAEVGKANIPDGGSTDGSSDRAIRQAKVIADTNKALIESEKDKIAKNKEIFKQEGVLFKKREEMRIEDLDSQFIINALIMDDEVAVADAKLENEKRKWTQALTKFEEGSSKYLAQKEQADIGIEEATKQHEQKTDEIKAKYRRKNTEAVNKDAETQTRNIEFEHARKQTLAKADFEQEAGLLQRQIDAAAEGSTAKANLMEAMEKLKIKYHNAEIERIVWLLTMQKNLAPQALKGYWQELIDAAKAGLKDFQTAAEDLFEGEGSWENKVKKWSEVINAAGDLINEVFERNISNIDAEINKWEELYDRKIALAEGDVKQQEALEQQKEVKTKALEKKKLETQKRQAKFSKAIQLQQATTATALAVIAALGSIPYTPANILLAKFVGAIGALQIATIAATPIPQFAEGVENLNRNTLGIINDGGNKEFVERNGQILTSDTMNALVPLKKGDTVHKDYDTLIRKSTILNGIYGGKNVSDDSDLLVKIEESIVKGFNKAKINNRVNNLIKIELPEDSRWN